MEVEGDFALEAGALDLDGDRRAVGSGRTVHLRQRCRGDGLGRDVDEPRRVVTAEALREGCHRRRGARRLGRHRVLELAEVARGLEADDIGPRRESLTHLAEDGTQARELSRRVAPPSSASLTLANAASTSAMRPTTASGSSAKRASISCGS